MELFALCRHNDLGDMVLLERILYDREGAAKRLEFYYVDLGWSDVLVVRMYEDSQDCAFELDMDTESEEVVNAR